MGSLWTLHVLLTCMENWSGGPFWTWGLCVNTEPVAISKISTAGWESKQRFWIRMVSSQTESAKPTTPSYQLGSHLRLYFIELLENHHFQRSGLLLPAPMSQVSVHRMLAFHWWKNKPGFIKLTSLSSMTEWQEYTSHKTRFPLNKNQPI